MVITSLKGLTRLPKVTHILIRFHLLHSNGCHAVSHQKDWFSCKNEHTEDNSLREDVMVGGEETVERPDGEKDHGKLKGRKRHSSIV